jgi:hypothetical protein
VGETDLGFFSDFGSNLLYAWRSRYCLTTARGPPAGLKRSRGFTRATAKPCSWHLFGWSSGSGGAQVPRLIGRFLMHGDQPAPAVAIPTPRTRRTARRVLFFGTYDARRYPRVRALQEGFAALGDDVLERSVLLRLDTAPRVRMLRPPWVVPLLAV